jgi:drug/metabolite transporter (DMT)-like permease
MMYRNLALYFTALLSLSMSANIVKISEGPITVFGFWRLVFAFIVVLPMAIGPGQLKKHLKEDRKDLYVAILSGLLFWGHLWTFFYASKNTSIAHTMIIYSTHPLFSALGAYFWFQEKITLRLIIAYILAALGVTVLVQPHLQLNHSGLLSGDLAALCSAALFSGYILSGKKSRQKLSNYTFSSIIYIVAAICFALMVNTQNLPWTGYANSFWVGIFLSTLFPTLLGHALFTYLMNFMNVNTMTLGKLIEPVFASIAAYFLFNEQLTSFTFVAFVLISLALLVLFLPFERWQGKIEGE